MSLILPSSVAPSAAGTLVPGAPPHPEEQNQHGEGSFGEALTRSLAAHETTGPQADSKQEQAAAGARPRKAATADAPEPNDPASLLTMALIPPETRVAKTAAGEARPAPVPANTKPAQAATGDDDVQGTDVADSSGAGKILTASHWAAAAAPQKCLVSGEPQTKAGAADTAVDTAPATLTAQPVSAESGASGPSGRRDGAKAGRTAVPAEDATAAPRLAGAIAAGESVSANARPVNPAPSGTSPGAAAPDAIDTSTTSPLSAMSSAAPPVPLAASAAEPMQTGLTLAPAVGSGPWSEALGHQMVRMGNARQQVAELSLNPPNLGPLKITLTLNELQAQATFVCAHAAVRAAVEAALPHLRATLADNGIFLGNTSVSADSASHPGAFTGQQPNESSRWGRHTSYGGQDEGADISAGDLAQERTVIRNHGGAVDTFA